MWFRSFKKIALKSTVRGNMLGFRVTTLKLSKTLLANIIKTYTQSLLKFNLNQSAF